MTALAVITYVILPGAAMLAWSYDPKQTKSLIHLARGLIALATVLFCLAMGNVVFAGLWALVILIAAIAASQKE